MRTWERENYIVTEAEFDNGLPYFEVVQNKKLIATIAPADIDAMQAIIEDLDKGEEVHGWVDRDGYRIVIEPVHTIQNILNGEFKFKQWSSHQKEPKEFENDLSQFGSFAVYNDFQEFLQHNDHLIVDEEGDPLDIEEILKSEKSYNAFINERELVIDQSNNLFYGDIANPLVHGASNTPEHKEHFAGLYEVIDESDLISFINEVLQDLGEVTHSSGSRNEYEVVEIIPDWREEFFAERKGKYTFE